MRVQLSRFPALVIAVIVLLFTGVSTARQIVTLNGFLDIGALDNEGEIAEFVLWTGNSEYTIINNESTKQLEDYVQSYLIISGTLERSESGALLLNVIDFSLDID
ncbi:MAG: hypothetical protein C4541_05770 [Candidatus Auribacter fodinae]|jgi:hypothetical protein|uniref:Uncharacterized protein n=1 Tax=Candidatus Auribacter fodinae TaxID=2093366 RepID=A0A3A4RD85_9BACT|nr:MAG: hypothetical protein C4541_05770 [Candidatus Auribacter fodinae]